MAVKPQQEQPKAKVEKVELKEQPKAKVDTYIMKVSHLSWGANSKNHFYVGNKPLISAKVMGKYADSLKVWLAKGWIEKGEYKK